MSNPYRSATLDVPESLKRQLVSYRRSVYRRKIGEAILLTLAVLLTASLAVLLFDRVIDSPPSLRLIVLLAVAGTAGAVPWSVYQWYYRRRRLVQAARLLSRRMPRLGDSLLGVLELAADSAEQARSGALCHAAMEQVAEQAQKCDLNEALPPSRFRFWAASALSVATVVLIVAALFPQATANAWARLLLPFGGPPRYTFTTIEPLPETLVVAHGEPFSISASLTDDTKWRPREATARIGRQAPVVATLKNGRYRFAFAGLRQPAELSLHLGDARPTINVIPKQRPELREIVARIELPAYLERQRPLEQDVSGGAVSVLRGSRVQLIAAADQKLAGAQADGRAISVDADTLQTPLIDVTGDQEATLQWEDQHGLSGAKPFVVELSVLEDRPPTVAATALPHEQILLTTATLPFEVVAQDDYGVRRVGYEWRVAGDSRGSPGGPSGERFLRQGGPAAATLEADAVFSAAKLAIPPGSVELRLFAEDYRPEGPRVYSQPYTFTLLSPEQHAAWLGSQLHRWHQQALEVRDREMQLHETNRALRSLSEAELERPESRRQLERQAAAEQANARRLARLSDEGAELIRKAVHNPAIGSEQLEQWAAMLQVLREIAAERMPAVAKLLETSANAPPSSPTAGVHRDPSASQSASGDAKQPSTSAAPSIVDAESAVDDPDRDSSPPATADAGGAGRTTLPQTTIRAASETSQPPTVEAALQQAVVVQDELLAEFQQLSAEISEILANLQGSTLVKRLKAGSREQEEVADRINEHLEEAFGRDADSLQQRRRRDLSALVARQRAASDDVAQIIDDMEAYQARRPLPRFQDVLAQMRHSDPSGGLRQIAEQIDDDLGWSLALTEYWADAFDRWADELVDPASSSQSPGGRSADSLSPAVVLEALRILRAEVNLREATRVAEQSRTVLNEDAYRREAEALAREQATLAGRVDQLVREITRQPQGRTSFPGELEMLAGVGKAMDDAAAILANHNTGAAAIAAETEAIERLLKSRQINPSGGNAGDSPGGRQGDGQADAALPWVAADQTADLPWRPSDAVQSTGRGGMSLPAEYRAGLDRYFNRLEAALDPAP